MLHTATSNCSKIPSPSIVSMDKGLSQLAESFPLLRNNFYSHQMRPAYKASYYLHVRTLHACYAITWKSNMLSKNEADMMWQEEKGMRSDSTMYFHVYIFLHNENHDAIWDVCQYIRFLIWKPLPTNESKFLPRGQAWAKVPLTFTGWIETETETASFQGTASHYRVN